MVSEPQLVEVILESLTREHVFSTFLLGKLALALLGLTNTHFLLHLSSSQSRIHPLGSLVLVLVSLMGSA